MNNLLSYCRLVDARISASEKDLPVRGSDLFKYEFIENSFPSYNQADGTGNFFSEALIFASTNPQIDKRLFINLPVQYMKTTSSEQVVYISKLF